MLTTVPFSGTYYTKFDCTHFFPTDNGGSSIDDGNVPFDAYLEHLGQRYIKAMNRLLQDLELNVCLEFESVSSPDEYNFSTDRIFATISKADVQLLRDYGHLHMAEFQKYLTSHFTSRDGFISYYRNNLALWMEKPTEQLDHNEVGSYLDFFINHRYDDNYRDGWEWEIYEAIFEDLSNWCYSNYEYEYPELMDRICDKLALLDKRWEPNQAIELNFNGHQFSVDNEYGDCHQVYAHVVAMINEGLLDEVEEVIS